MNLPNSVFTEEAIEQLDKELASIPLSSRPMIWARATGASYAQLRNWLDGEVSALEEAQRAEFLSRLRTSRLHTAAFMELAAGYVLSTPANVVELGPRLYDQTPDILLTLADGRQTLFELWHRGISDSAKRRNAAWTELARQLSKIRVPLALAIVPRDEESDPPPPKARAAIARGIADWLAQPNVAVGSTRRIASIDFRVVGRANGAHLDLVSTRIGSVTTRDDVVKAIELKVAKYRVLLERLNLPFVVVVSGGEGASLTSEQLFEILAGRNTVSMSIPASAPQALTSGSIRMRLSEAVPAFDPVLSAVAWFDAKDGADASVGPWWHNPKADHPVEVS